jgi:6-pyruvoyltetrahydropterin/6-carboxytetrahydropterin synthase
MTSIFATFSFEAAHYLPHVPAGHKCGRMHGHNWTVEIHVTGELDKRGWVVDFYEIENAWKELVYARLDHRVLNDVPGLENPTTEIIGKWIYDNLVTQVDMEQGHVVVRETPSFGAIYPARP